MREILFKAKRHDGEWVEGYYVKNAKEKTKFDSIIITDIDCPYPEFFEFDEIDENTLCQYTGLTDKNGRKIWENDIVKYTDMITYAEKIDRIEWNETHASFVRLHKSKMGLQYLNIDEFIANRCEVIGNIFDNPELLESEV